jgi:hypothetical protein
MEDQKLLDANFDLEQGILRCWNLTTDLSSLSEDVAAGEITAEAAVKMLESYARVYDHQFNRTFLLYETVCRGLYQLRKSQTATAEPVFDPLFDGVVKTPRAKIKKNSKKG